MALKGIRSPLQFAPQGTLMLAENAEYVQGQVNRVVNVRGSDESGTLRGEYPWRPEIGSALDLARHHPKDVVEDLAEGFAERALSTWVPDAVFSSASVERTDRLSYRIRISWTLRGEREVRGAEGEIK